MLKDEIKKIKKWPKKWPELTYQTRDSCHKIEIIPWKAKWNKLQISISNQPNVEGLDLKNQLKKEHKKWFESIC
jgi:hypothetical protein